MLTYSALLPEESVIEEAAAEGALARLYGSALAVELEFGLQY